MYSVLDSRVFVCLVLKIFQVLVVDLFAIEMLWKLVYLRTLCSAKMTLSAKIEN